MTLTLETLGVQVINWFINASFSVHGNMRSHTGGFMTICKGCVYGTSVRHKLNTKSSKKADLVGSRDVPTTGHMDQVFLGGSGIKIDEYTV